ncbi:MAG: hypothetical protein J1F10_01605 [Muribaculaceae bacterium]|nr:hypothetical protein [Muribaculaceae bacterium]
MKKSIYAALAFAMVVIMTGCSKKLNQFDSEYFTTNPNPLEAVADKVPGTVTANVPAKFFVKNAEVTVTPVLVYGDKEATSAPYYFQGEKVNGNNQVIPYETGSTVTIPVNFNYEPEMINSVLYLAFDVRQGNKTYTLPRVEVGTGVIATSTLGYAESVTPALAADKFQRIINEKHKADINFLIYQTNIRANQLKSDALAELNKKVSEAQTDDRLEVEGINISSYASPDGGVKINTTIAEGREKSTQKYLNETIKKNKYTEVGDLTAEFTAQDWEGFQELVSKSNIQDKDLIISVLSMYKDPETREREIRNLSAAFDQLAQEILPKLRYSRLTASINVIGKSDEEIKEAFEKDPKSLTIEEILYCASLYDDNSKKMEIYEAATKIYPNDYRTYNNLGMTKYIAGDYDAASANFNKAAKLAPNAPEVNMNNGLISLLNKDYRDARNSFGAAAGVDELPEALGTLYIKAGDYNAAVKAFGDVKSNNAGLAQLLNKDYSAANNTLNAVAEPDAITYYLLAVVGARTNNDQQVYNNLRKVAAADKDLLERAKVDKEFAKFNLSSIN